MSEAQMLFSGRGLGSIFESTHISPHKGLSALRPSGLPPNLTNPLNTLMAPPPARYQKNLAMADLQQLPESFDWREEAKKRNIRLEGVKNQKGCGNCWAMAISSTLCDRYNARGIPSPDLSPLYLIACDKQQDACNGGSIQSAALFCETRGIAANNCANWENWCDSNECSEEVKDVSCNFEDCNVWHSEKNSTHTINGNKLSSPIVPDIQPIFIPTQQDISRIDATFTQDPISVQNQLKAEILANGPVVTSFWVFPDFMDSSPTPWSSTNNIYIHGAYGDIQGYAGGHAVEIVGWGKGTAGKYGELSYWIVKNSWGPEWNNGGYFKFAMTQYKNKSGKSITDVTINGYTGLDVPLQCSMQGRVGTFGGSVVFSPDETGKKNPKDWSGDNTGDNTGSGSNFKDWFNKYWWVVLLLVLFVVLVVGISI